MRFNKALVLASCFAGENSFGMITSTIHVLILVPVFFVMMKERRVKGAMLCTSGRN
jgi:hypothetical protein